MADEDLIEDLALRVASQSARLDGHDIVLDGHRAELDAIRERLNPTSLESSIAPWWFDRMTRTEAREAVEVLTHWVCNEIIPVYDEFYVSKGYQERLSEEDAVGSNPGAKLLPHGQRLKACWFAHPRILQLFAGLHWEYREARKDAAYETAPRSFALYAVDDVLDKCRDLQAECDEECRNLGIAARRLTWERRERWVRDFLASRPVNRS